MGLRLDKVKSGVLLEMVCHKCKKKNITAEKICECGESLIILEFESKEQDEIN